MHDLEVIQTFIRLNASVKYNLPIRPSEMGLIIYLKNMEDKKPSSIAKYFGVTRAQIAKMTKSLIEKKYIYTEKSNNDSRSINLYISQEAINLIDITLMEYTKTIDLLKSRMGIKYDEFIDNLKEVNKILQEEDI